ncbi:UAA transporter [Mycotypha africana]|uniref:UAA transporter n=1 Tax=Mycotypha africana TaxID=64632 RepID=UPI002300DE86|nr:UAA transporter [Mycotypha africana]KAI8987567.1 UAA transporter [Mycotypha africana]
MDNSNAFTTALISLIASDFPMILSLIFGGCCSNVFALEVLLTKTPASFLGQLITLGQFAFVALEGLRHHLTFGKYGLPCLKRTTVPLSRWFLLVTIFFIVSLLNNLALGYNISVPLHIIFRSGGLIMNMILGALILKKRYSMEQIIGVLFVTAGVIWATMDNASTHTQVVHQGGTSSTSEFLTGIFILLVAMVLSAGMGLIQEVTYKKYGKQWREGLFYTHFLALPMFLLGYNDLIVQINAYNNSPKMSIPAILHQVPLLDNIVNLIPASVLPALEQFHMRKLWAFLIMNVLTQYVCIAGVNRMTSVATSLTLNLVLNLRKFTSLIFSIVYFNNPFGLGAKLGSALVFFGTLIYTHAGIKANNNNNRKKQIAPKNNGKKTDSAIITSPPAEGKERTRLVI